MEDPNPDLSDPTALPLILPGDSHHLNQEKNAQGNQRGSQISAPHMPNVQRDLVLDI